MSAQLRQALLKSLRAQLRPVTVTERRAYTRISQKHGETEQTLAYVSGRRGLRLDIPGHASIRVKDADDIPAAVAALVAKAQSDA